MRVPGRALPLAVVAAVVLVGLGAGVLPLDPAAVRGAAGLEVLRPPSAEHLLGTDDRGRDVLARLVLGTRTSVLLALAAVALAAVAGVGLAALATLRGRLLDRALVAACDVVAAVPALVLVVAVQGLAGRASFTALVVLVAVPQAVVFARVTRAELRRHLAAPFCEAARALGVGPVRLVARHALPHAVPHLAVTAAAGLSAAFLAEAALTFVGLGVPDGTPSLGELLRQAHENGLAWWLATPAGAVVVAVGLAAHRLADRPAG